MTPKRIQRKRTKGWQMPDGAVYVGRPSKWGNPFVVGKSVTIQLGDPPWVELPIETLAMAVNLYRNWRQLEPPPDLHLLRGRDLACWCPLDQPCHADVLLELANQEMPR